MKRTTTINVVITLVSNEATYEDHHNLINELLAELGDGNDTTIVSTKLISVESK